MLLSPVPVAFVAAAVNPLVHAETVLFVVLILALVDAAICPLIQTVAIHVVFLPFAFKAPAVGPLVDPQTTDSVFNPVAGIGAAIGPLIQAHTVLLTLDVIPLIPTAVCPLLYSVAMLQVILPNALVLSSIHMSVGPSSVRFIERPEAFVHVSVRMHKFAFPMGSVILPLADVFGSIGPLLLTIAVSEAPLPLAGVDGP